MDQPTVPWTDILRIHDLGNTLVALISARRFLVPEIKPLMVAEGIIATCGRPGDAFHKGTKWTAAGVSHRCLLSYFHLFAFGIRTA